MPTPAVPGTPYLSVDVTAEVTTYAYDAMGNLDLVTLDNGLHSKYAYDDMNRLTSLVHFLDDGTVTDQYDSADTLLSMYEYTLDAAGRRTDAIETDAADDQNYFKWT